MSKRHNRAFFLCAFFICAAFIGHAQVDREELEKNQAPVRFLNYEGPQARVESREQIRRIGTGLGQAIKAGQRRTGANNRYFVIHVISAPEGSKLDADIFGLGSDVGVDHIRNLRTIIQGYLQEAYNYSAADALLLAEYITIYNAVYRGNWNYFTGRYKKPVMEYLTPQQIGLSVRFDEWPGRTLMLIPLGIGGLSAIDTTTISDNRVVEEMRKEDGLGLEQRRDMVDLKEREAEEAERRAEEQRAGIKKEEQAIAEERSQLEKDQQQTAQDRRQLEADRESITPAEADRREQEIAGRESQAEQKSGELDRREEELVLQQDEAAGQEQFSEQKTEEARQDRENIAGDQQTLIERGEAPQGIIAVNIEKGDSGQGRILALEPANGRELRRSPIDSVYVRALVIINGKVLAIAGENRGNAAVRLIEVNARTLEMAKQGDDDIHLGSLIWVNGNDLYAITVNLTNGTLNLGRFNTDLVLQAKSGIAVHPNASVSIQQGILITQKSDGAAVLLNPANLSEMTK